MTLLLGGASVASGQSLDMIGVTLLRTVTTNINGEGIRVVQVEADADGTNGSPYWFEVNPSHAAVTQPVSLFTYRSILGSSSSYPNSVGSESPHANGVAANFYGLSAGVATNVVHVDNYELNYFYPTYIVPSTPPNPNARIINQSFAIPADVPTQQTHDSRWDNAAAARNTLFLSGVGNGGSVKPPGTCYNGIGVGVIRLNGILGSSSIGPTLDNGRCKPDLVAPGPPDNVTSWSTPMVSGATALLLQAGIRGDGGSDTNSATDMRTLKALLLNGAVKPADWTNSTITPLDARYGSGILNAFNSYMQLAGGKHTRIEQTEVSAGSSHPPGSATGNIAAHHGWDYDTISSTKVGGGLDRINHYYFNLTNNSGNAPFVATATLVWNRPNPQPGSGINDLNFYLYDATTDALVAESVSTVDNVEHIHVKSLPPGRYDLQVLKRGGNGSQYLTANEDYALAWEFFNVVLSMSFDATNSTATLTWPIYPDGFVPQYKANLNPSLNWTDDTTTPEVTNGVNRVNLPASGSKLFRLVRP